MRLRTSVIKNEVERQQNKTPSLSLNEQKTLVRLRKAHQAFFKTFINADRKHIHLKRVRTDPGPSSLGHHESL